MNHAGWSVILSEKRYPLFRITLVRGAGIARARRGAARMGVVAPGVHPPLQGEGRRAATAARRGGVLQSRRAPPPPASRCALWPTSPTQGRGENTPPFSRRAFAPELCRYQANKQKAGRDLRQTAPVVGPAAVTIMRGCSPDGAERNPGAALKLHRRPGLRSAPSGLHPCVIMMPPVPPPAASDEDRARMLFVCLGSQQDSGAKARRENGLPCRVN